MGVRFFGLAEKGKRWKNWQISPNCAKMTSLPSVFTGAQYSKIQIHTTIYFEFYSIIPKLRSHLIWSLKVVDLWGRKTLSDGPRDHLRFFIVAATLPNALWGHCNKLKIALLFLSGIFILLFLLFPSLRRSDM